MKAELLIIASTAREAHDWNRGVALVNVHAVGVMSQILGCRPRIVLVIQDAMWGDWSESTRERLEEWFKIEVASRLLPGSSLVRVEALTIYHVEKLAKLLRDNPNNNGPAMEWIEKNKLDLPQTWNPVYKETIQAIKKRSADALKGYGFDAVCIDYIDNVTKPAPADPYALHRVLNASRNVERYSPGIELSIREDNIPAAVLARRAPKHIVVPTDLDDHLIPDAEPEGIVPRPKRS